jgi:uncharacterized Tic20 family protein
MRAAMHGQHARIWAQPRSAGPASGGRLRDGAISGSDRSWAIWIHVSPFAALFFQMLIVAPLVLWLMRRDKSAFVDDHGREMVNVLITMLIISASSIFLFTIPFVIAWVIVTMINQIRAAVAASNGEYFRYPMTFRFLS